MADTHKGREGVGLSTSSASGRIGAWCAILGSVIGLVATLVHPKDFVAYDSADHLQTIAADGTWVFSHFAFLIANMILLWGLIAIADSLARTAGAVLAKLATTAAVIGAAITVVFFMIDGFGMKAVAVLWLNASPAEGDAALTTALLMAKLGLASASVYCLWYLGLAPILFGAAMMQSARMPGFVGLIAILGGVVGMASGATIYLYGYSTIGTIAFILAQSLFLIWPLVAGVLLLSPAPE